MEGQRPSSIHGYYHPRTSRIYLSIETIEDRDLRCTGGRASRWTVNLHRESRGVQHRIFRGPDNNAVYPWPVVYHDPSDSWKLLLL